MNERIMQFRVGVMVLAAILIAAILVLLFKGSSLMQGTYPIYIKFSEAPGVSRDTPVRMDGIRIGRVQEVQFANRDTRRDRYRRDRPQPHALQRRSVPGDVFAADGRRRVGVRAGRRRRRQPSSHRAGDYPAGTVAPEPHGLAGRYAATGSRDLGDPQHGRPRH